MKTAVSIVLLSMAIFLISGCAGVEVKNEQKSSREITIKNFGQVRSMPINIEDSITINLSNSQLHEFPEGEKHFRFVRIPPAEKRSYFVFRSYSSSVPRKLKVVIPKFMFLNEEGDHIQTITASTIIRDEEYWRGTSFNGRVSIPDKAKYAVIYAAEQADIPKMHRTYRGRRWSVAPIEAGKFKLTLTEQPAVLLSDSKSTGESGKLQLFYLSAVDGKRVRNAINDSNQASTKMGLRSRFVAVLTTRELPVKKLKVRLTGSHASAVPIKEIIRSIKGEFLYVSGEVEFEPELGKKYIVNGELKEKGSAVWIEEEGTGKIVTEKFVEPI